MIKKAMLRFSNNLQAELLAKVMQNEEYEVRITSSLSEALRHTNHHSPCIAIFDDIEFHKISIKNAKVLSKLKSSLKCLVLVNRTDRRMIEWLFQAKADGIILESSGLTTILSGLHAVSHGQKYVDDNVIKIRSNTFMLDETVLTERERQICELIRKKLTSAQIAVILQISKRTVDTIRYNIRRKLNINNGKWLHIP
jgi:DNA-binding NarL/FixJ family response regulator